MSVDPRHEEKRLRRIFQRARWLALAAPMALPLACGPDDSADPISLGDGAGGGDGNDGNAEPDADEPLASAVPIEALAPAASCAPATITPNPPDDCGNYVRLSCGLPAGVVPASNCYLFINDCKQVCPGFYFNCHAVNDSCQNGQIVKDARGGIDIDCSICSKGIGRLPAGLAPARRARATSALGGWFAAAAHLEAASVHAFDRLHDELARHGAPGRLLRAARRARRDEVRHARLTGRMARRFGGVPVAARVDEVPARALAAVALENAVEGCVRETFGALVASFQAENATDPEVARLMESIARDETRHAALSWAVADWAEARLDAGARAVTAEACLRAVDGLRRDTNAQVPGELMTRAGLPDAAQQRALIGALEEQLWGRAGWGDGR